LERYQIMNGLFWKDSTEGEIDQTIQKVANLIKKYKLETAGVLFLSSIKPLCFMGGPLARVFVSPWLHALGINTQHYINTFEDLNNVEKLVKLLEEGKI